MQTSPELESGDENQERIVVGAVVGVVIALVIGLVAQQKGYLDDWLGGSAKFTKAAAPVLAWVHKEAAGDPQRILVSGFVPDEKTGDAILAELKKEFPGSEFKSAVRVDADKSPADKKKKKKGDSVLRISFAADSPNEMWPRARFGEVKRLELVWKDQLVTARGAIYGHRTELEAAFNALSKEHKGAIQFRDAQRPNIPVEKLQNDVSMALAGRTMTFDAAGAIDAKDANGAAIVAAVAPLLRDLTGLEVWISAGADDRVAAQRQAESVKTALAAAGADAGGLRAVPALKSNPLMFIVREKD
jgi:hypothetical protein